MLKVDCQEGGSILDAIKLITKEKQVLRRNLIDEQLSEPKPNALMLVNGKEISVLNGLETQLGDGDEIVLVPVIHGG
jgi:molybdopterin converting factor small subunit